MSEEITMKIEITHGDAIHTATTRLRAYQINKSLYESREITERPQLSIQLENGGGYAMTVDSIETTSNELLPEVPK